MGDYCFSSSKEAFQDLLFQEDCYVLPSADTENQINHYSKEFNNYFEQGISVLLEEVSSTIEGNDLLPKAQNTPINFHDHLQDHSNVVVSSLVDQPSNYDQVSLFVDENESHINPFGGDYSLASLAENKEMGAESREFAKNRSSEVGIDVEEESVVKKQDHNAKERMRRLKLHETYLSLGSLLPISKTSKKRWTAPVIIDKALDYIPELESEIEGLTQKKSSVLLTIEKNRLNTITKNNTTYTDSKLSEALTVSVNKVRQGELIFQICIKSSSNNVFSNLIQNFEHRGIRILSASTLSVCDDRDCYTIHIQMNESSSSTDGGDCTADLKEKITSWLT